MPQLTACPAGLGSIMPSKLIASRPSSSILSSLLNFSGGTIETTEPRRLRVWRRCESMLLMLWILRIEAGEDERVEEPQ